MLCWLKNPKTCEVVAVLMAPFSSFKKLRYAYSKSILGKGIDREHSVIDWWHSIQYNYFLSWLQLNGFGGVKLLVGRAKSKILILRSDAKKGCGAFENTLEPVSDCKHGIKSKILSSSCILIGVEISYNLEMTKSNKKLSDVFLI